MSYANGTQFYNLPQTVGTDKRDWFDANAAFAAVDAALHAAATGQAADAEAIAAINTSLAADEANIASLQTASTTHSSEISALQATVASQGTAIGDVRQDAEDMISAFNEGAASVSTHAYAIGDYFIYNDVLYKATTAIAIGDTIVPNTNCSATNVTSEIKVINADIDEVKSDLGNKTTASAVGGNDAFSKIATVYTDLQNVNGKLVGDLVAIATKGADNYAGFSLPRATSYAIVQASTPSGIILADGTDYNVVLNDASMGYLLIGIHNANVSTVVVRVTVTG
jgi:hypothetical protein